MNAKNCNLVLLFAKQSFAHAETVKVTHQILVYLLGLFRWLRVHDSPLDLIFRPDNGTAFCTFLFHGRIVSGLGRGRKSGGVFRVGFNMKNAERWHGGAE